MKKDLGVYIHIPFCVKKCNYCDFPSYVCNKEVQKMYVDTLIREIKSSVAYADDFKLNTVFIGGGTPSVLPASEIERILGTLFETFSVKEQPVEVTIECNPNTVTKEKLEAYKKAGINRLSLGLQSADAEELKLLGRVHSLSDWEEAFDMARECGFDNINTDIISGIPGQSIDSFAKTLNTVIKKGPEHISVYSLIIEEGTPFYDIYNEDRLSDEEFDEWEERDRQIYEETLRIMHMNGYDRYEISNYCKDGCECKHNLVYWQRGDYLGFGVSAASLVNNVRFANTKDVDTYIYAESFQGEPVKNDVEKLSIRDQMGEYMMLGLRLIKGIDVKDFEAYFGVSVYDIFGDIIEHWAMQGMLIENDDRIYCSEKGINICNLIMADFLEEV